MLTSIAACGCHAHGAHAAPVSFSVLVRIAGCRGCDCLHPRALTDGAILMQPAWLQAVNKLRLPFEASKHATCAAERSVVSNLLPVCAHVLVTKSVGVVKIGRQVDTPNTKT